MYSQQDTTKEKILTFLFQNKGMEGTAQEIADKTKTPLQNVQRALIQLEISNQVKRACDVGEKKGKGGFGGTVIYYGISPEYKPNP